MVISVGDKPTMCRKKAFTLIELLVVIAIIAMLLAIIAPALNRAKEHAKFLLCKTNLKAYHMGMRLYTSEEDDKYPNSHTSIFDGTQTGFTGIHQWHDKRISPSSDPRNAGPLWPFLENDKIHMCSTFKIFAKKYPECNNPTAGCTSSIPIEPQYSYSQNHYLGGGSMSNPLGVMKELEVINPAGVLLFVEETIWRIPALAATHVLNDTCFFTRHPNDPAGFVQSGYGGGDCIATYHNTPLTRKDEGLGNAVFIDGHVELCDSTIEHTTSWGRMTESYRLAWPKGSSGYQPTCPY